MHIIHLMKMLCLPLFAVSAGVLVMLICQPKEKARAVYGSEIFFIGMMLGLVLYGFLVLGLASFKIFTPARCAWLLLIVNAGLLVVYRKNKKHELLFKSLEKGHIALLGVILILGSAYAYGAESILDGRDDGMYALTAAALVEQKSQVWKWENLTALQELLPTTVMQIEQRSLALYHEPFSVTNDGADFFPAVLSLGYILFKLNGLPLIYTLLGMINLYLVFYVTLRFFEDDFATAALCTFFYAINMAVISTARLGLTEIFSNALLLAIILLILRRIDDDKAGIPLLGFLLTAAFLTHPANYFFLVPLSFLFSAKPYTASHRTILVSTLALAVIVSLLYYHQFDVLYITALSKIVLLMILISMGIIAAAALVRCLDKRHTIENRAMALNRSSYYAFAAALVLACIFSYFIRPYYDIIDVVLKHLMGKSASLPYDTERAKYVFNRFGFYITAFGIFGGVSGYLLWKWKNLNKIDLPKLATILGFAVFSAIFLLTTSTHDWHFFTARRYVVLTVLGFLMFFSFLVVFLYRQGRMYLKVSAVILAGIYVYNAVLVAAPFVFFRELEGNNKFITELSRTLPDQQPVLTIDCGSIVPVLEFVYHKNIVPLTASDGPTVDAVMSHFNTVSLVLCSSGDNRSDYMPYFSKYFGKRKVKLVADFDQHMPGSEQVREDVPRRTVLHRYGYAVLELSDTAGRREFDLVNNPAWSGLYSDGWTKNIFSIALPAIPDPAGAYGLAMDLTRPADVQGPVSIAVNGNKLKEIQCGQHCTIDVSLPLRYLRTANAGVGGGHAGNTIVFSSTAGFIPKEHGTNGDERELHFQIGKCIFYNER